MTTIFRVENPATMQGLWYDKDGNFNPFVKKLSEGKCKELPMEFDSLYKEAGYAWFSGCNDFPEMRNWFSLQDLVELGKAGYHLYRFEVAAFKQVPGHVIFTRESILDQAKLDIGLLTGA